MDEIVVSFNRTVETLPPEQQRRIDDLSSSRQAGGWWWFRDCSGLMVAKVQDPAHVDPEEAERKKQAPLMASKAYVASMARKTVESVCANLAPEIVDIRKCIDLLSEHVKGIEGEAIHKTLDAAALDEMASMAQRLDTLESTLHEIADNGLRYRGFWRDGQKAKRGDAYTHDGSLWWAIRGTEDKPCHESTDWQIAVRKGRDAR